MTIMIKSEMYCLHLQDTHIGVSEYVSPSYTKHIIHKNIFPNKWECIIISKEEYDLLCSINDDNIFLLVAFQIFKKHDK
jgi:hypothetical protein